LQKEPNDQHEKTPTGKPKTRIKGNGRHQRLEGGTNLGGPNTRPATKKKSSNETKEQLPRGKGLKLHHANNLENKSTYKPCGNKRNKYVISEKEKASIMEIEG